jgi:hypothetical protein
MNVEIQQTYSPLGPGKFNEMTVFETPAKLRSRRLLRPTINRHQTQQTMTISA